MIPVTLTRENANKITRIDGGSSVEIPGGVFAKGDMLILFNNSDDSVILESKITKTYLSGNKDIKTSIEWPPRAIINVIFVDHDLMVATVETI